MRIVALWKKLWVSIPLVLLTLVTYGMSSGPNEVPRILTQRSLGPDTGDLDRRRVG